MEKIAYIVPSETMIPTTEEVLKEEIVKGRVDVLTTDVFRPLAEYRRLCSEGYGCIIARGGTYNDLMQCADAVPVLQEKIRTSDILYMLNLVRKEYAGKIYVIIHESTAQKFEETSGLFGFPVEIKRYRSPEILKQLIEDIPESDVLVLSSGIAASISDRTDLRYVELLNRDSTIRETVRRAEEYLRQFQENIKKVNVMASILNNVDEGILIFDEQYIVREMNVKAEDLLQVDAETVIGGHIDLVIPDLPPKRETGNCNVNSPRTFMRQIGRIMVNFSIHPFEFFKGEVRYIATMQDVTKIQELEHNIRLNLAKKGFAAKYRFHDILTQDPAMENLITRAGTIAKFEGSVLIYGENGTGKELFAQSIHHGSRRKDGPFVAVNCAALTESLLESELFGYVGGAFTGARKEGKAGLFELAHKGTIFLDEINSMPLNLQAKILRVIEQQEVMRVGSDYVIPLDVRIIAASNTDLTEHINNGTFRKDLYFRLNTFRLNLPAMNQRKGDILLLFKHYLSELEHVKPERLEISSDFIKSLEEHPWHGNVREIKSTALRYHAFGGDNSTGAILMQEKREDSLVDDNFKIDLHQLNKTIEQMVIASLLEKDMSKSDIASALGISRQALYKKINKNE